MTELFYKLACEKYEDTAKEIDWSVIPWQDWQQILPDYLVEDIERVRRSSWADAPYIFDCYVGKAYGSISMAVRDKKIIWEQAQALRRKYIYTALDKGKAQRTA